MLASLDHFYEIYGASCWNGRLQSLQFILLLVQLKILDVDKKASKWF